MKATLVFCLELIAAQAQDSAPPTLKGRVVDPSDAVIPNITIQIRNSVANEATTAVTDSQGSFAIPLPPGNYSVSVETPGFEKFTLGGLALNAGETRSITVTLEIGAVAELVTVTAKAPDFQEALEVREVRESSARDVGEALSKVEGLWKIRKGGIANDVVLRGFQQGNINMLVDGVRIYGACPNHMDPPAFHVDFAEIQQVEVTKGAFDITNEGSLGGLVNIRLKDPARGLHFTPNFSTGSFGYYNPSLTASASNDKYYGLAGYSFRRAQPYRDGAGKRFTEYANYQPASQDASAFAIQTGWLKFGAAPFENHHLELDYTRQAGDQVLYPYLQMDALYDNADRLNARYQINDLSSAFKRLRFQSYFTRVKHWMTDEDRVSAIGAPRPYSMATFAGTKALGGKAEADFSGFTAGFEGYLRNWNAVNTMRMSAMYMDQPSIPNVNLLLGGLYGEYRRTFFEKLRFRAGARLDSASSQARSPALNTDLYWAYKGARTLSKTDTQPSGNFQLAYALPKGFDLFAGVGHTVRLPDPEERFMALKRSGSDWVGNPNLRPTQNSEADLGINYRSRRFSVRPTVFYSRLTDFITLHNQPKINPTPYVMNSAARSYENVQAKMYGGELAYHVVLSRTLALLGGLSYTRGAKQPIPAARILDRNLAEIPPLKSRTALRYGARRFFAEVESVLANAQGRVDSDLREQRTPGYAVVNLKAGLHTSKVNLALGLDNLLDRFYYEHFSYQRDAFRTGTKVPEPGRSVFLTIAYGF